MQKFKLDTKKLFNIQDIRFCHLSSSLTYSNENRPTLKLIQNIVVADVAIYVCIMCLIR